MRPARPFSHGMLRRMRCASISSDPTWSLNPIKPCPTQAESVSATAAASRHSACSVHRTSEPSRGASSAAAWVAAVVVAASLGVWAAWLYRIPLDYACAWGTNPMGAAHFRAALHVPIAVADAATFRAGFVACLALSWLGYLALLATGLSGGAPPAGRVLRLAAVTVVAIAFLGPPSLSCDAYAYVGYARLAVVHHLSPYVETQVTLVRLGDPTGTFLRWPIASPYGPGWTLLSMAIVFLLPKGGLLAPLLAFKVLGAVAVLGSATAGRRLARHLSPGREDLVFAALALNPLFVIEGVASAHNDVVMMALVLWAFVFATERRWTWAFLLLGAASSIKFMPLLLAPWSRSEMRART